jgi:cytochrome c oxidase subunit 4
MSAERLERSPSPLLVFGLLLALAGLSYGASFLSLGAMRVPIALVIALLKAVLVAAFFMELAVQRPTNRLVVVTSLLLVVTLIVLMVTDELFRMAVRPLPG